jgi:hypothetical protein
VISFKFELRWLSHAVSVIASQFVKVEDVAMPDKSKYNLDFRPRRYFEFYDPAKEIISRIGISLMELRGFEPLAS